MYRFSFAFGKGMSALALTLWLAGCSWHPYRMDIQQGNYITQEMLLRIHPGMTKAEVRQAAGTPVFTDPFHPEIWDYDYLYFPNRGKPVKRRLRLTFDGDELKDIAGDVSGLPHEPPIVPKTPLWVGKGR